MCDGAHEPCGPRRCPSQRGEQRRAYRRALYAAQKAAAASEVHDVPDQPEHPSSTDAIPTVEQVQERIDAAKAVWMTYAKDNNPENAAAYEHAVQQVGEYVSAQVDEEIRRRLDSADDDFARLDTFRSELDADIDAYARDKKAYEQWVRDSTRKMRTLQRDEQQLIVDEGQQRVDELEARRVELASRHRSLEEKVAERGVAEGRIAAEVLSNYRPFGTRAPDIHPSSSKRAHAVIEQASQAFPDSWSQRASIGTPMIVKESKARAFYRDRSRLTVTDVEDFGYSDTPDRDPDWPTKKSMPPAPDKGLDERMAELGQPRGIPQWVAVRNPDTGRWQWKLRVTDKSEKIISELRVPSSASGDASTHQTAVHELSHRVESRHRQLSVACIAFRDRRTTNADGSRHRLQQYAKGEHVRPDDFVTAYIGKDYNSDVHTEVLSMGMESVFGGSQGSLKGYHGHQADREHRNLILGLCASA
ncbi:hypothetical protein Br6_04857 [Rhodococcus sp. Br-6]|nr:hypothetical protein Br6_04857 [Rhodococcus sp. Br-6]